MASVAAAAAMGEPQKRWRAATIQVGGMTCSACSSTVERSLAGTTGIREASVSCVTGLARVEFDAVTVHLEELLDAIECVGFDAILAQDEEITTQAMPTALTQDTSIAVEIKVSGMTCSACSGTVERILQSLPGVSRATVSLILNRAYVVCNATVQTPESLCDEIECVGFDAEVVCTGTADTLSGHATLHVKSTCPDEKLEETVRALQGVLSCRTLASGQQRITYDPHALGARRLLAQIKESLGAQFEVEWTSVSGADEQLQGHLRHIEELQRDLFRALPPAAVMFFLVILLPSLTRGRVLMDMLMTEVHPGLTLWTIFGLLNATPVHFIVGRRFHQAAYAALKRGTPNMDVLVSVACNTAYFYSLSIVLFCLTVSDNTGSSHQLGMATGHFLAMGPFLIAVVLLGKTIESKAKLKAMEALTDIPSSLPATALLCEGGGDSTIPLELVELGDVLRIFAGSRIPVDGSMCSDVGVHVDESLLTGESKPISKKDGDMLFGGTMCLSGGCLMRVTKVGGDTTLGQMVKLVQDAQASKAGVQRVADSIARVFVPAVVGLAVFTFVTWAGLVFIGFVEVPTSHNAGGGLAADGAVPGSLKLLFAMKFGIAVLMIACPCAMGLATPMAVMVSTGLAAKRGCLVKSAEALELSACLDVVVLDKTGTITVGAPCISSAAICAEAFAPMEHAWSTLCSSAARSKTTEDVDVSAPPVLVVDAQGAWHEGNETGKLQDCFWWILGNLESASDHPIAKCILSAVQGMRHLPPIVAPQDFEVETGRGVRCFLGELGGVTARVGNLAYFTETSTEKMTPSGQALLQWMRDMQQQSNIVVFLHIDGRPFGAVALQDPIREDALWVVDYMKSTLGVDVWLCTGDSTATAQTIANQVGIARVVAEALPTTKSECIAKLQRPRRPGARPRRVAFIGDGMNDSPALAQADVGVALGVGAHVAVEAADVALVRSELGDCVTFLALSKATFRTILLNFFWAFCFNFLCLPIAAGIFYPTVYIPPLAAGLGMACSSLLVVCSSLTLKRFKAPQPIHSQARRWRPSNFEFLIGPEDALRDSDTSGAAETKRFTSKGLEKFKPQAIPMSLKPQRVGSSKYENLV